MGEHNFISFRRYDSHGLESDALRLTGQPHPRTPGDAKMAAATAHPFERRVAETHISKSDVNNLIMDYLITEGYPSAAEKFAAEANIQPKADLSCIQERVQIRDSIHRGDLQAAIELINELNPELLDADKKLHFSLLRLQLVELIRQSFTSSDATLVGRAIEFAQNNLAPYAPLEPQFKYDLERAMALLIVPKESWSKANIRYLVRARAWAEQLAREKKMDLPQHISLGLDGDKHSKDSQNGHNGDTEMTENGGEDASGGDAELARYTNILT